MDPDAPFGSVDATKINEGGSESSEVSPEFTIDEAIESIGFGLFQVRLTVFSALVWLSDAMEMMMLAVLGPAVQCLWSLPTYQVAMITTVVFIGMGLGSAPWGVACDKYGRKRTLRITTFFIVFFGLATAVAPSYYWLLAIRFCVGFFIASAPHAVTYYSEFLPIKSRALCISMLQFAFASGSCIEALLAFLVMDSLGWRYLVGLSVIPVLTVLFYFPFVPPSPRFLMVKGRVAEAYKVLESAARQNCRKLPPGKLVLAVEAKADSEDDQAPMLEPQVASDTDSTTSPPPEGKETKPEKAGNLLEVFSRKYVATSVMLMVIWFGCGFSYYGAVLFTTELFIYDNHCGTGNATSVDLTCRELTKSDYLQFLITSAAEFPGILATIILSDLIGRKLTLTVEFLLPAVFYCLLTLCTGAHDQIVKTAFLFGIRACVTGAFQSAYLYTPEAYPTRIRASIISLCSMMARVGALVAPFVATVLLQANFYATIGVYAGVAVVAAIFSFLLPFETRGSKLGEEGKRRFLC